MGSLANDGGAPAPSPTSSGELGKSNVPLKSWDVKFYSIVCKTQAIQKAIPPCQKCGGTLRGNGGNQYAYRLVCNGKSCNKTISAASLTEIIENNYEKASKEAPEVLEYKKTATTQRFFTDMAPMAAV